MCSAHNNMQKARNHRILSAIAGLLRFPSLSQEHLLLLLSGLRKAFGELCQREHRIELVVDDRPDDGRRHRRQPDEACHVALVLAKPLRQLHHSDRECPVKSNPLHGACHFRANYLKPGDLRLFIPRRSLGSLEKAKTSQKAKDFTQVLNSFLCLSGLESNPLSRP